MHDGTHNAAPELGFELLVAHIVVEKLEFLHSFCLVVEDLDHLLTCDGLLHIAVDSAESGLLSRVILGGALCHHTRKKGKERYEDYGDKGQDPVGGDHKDEGACQSDNARDERGQGVVQHYVDVVDIVGEA